MFLLPPSPTGLNTEGIYRVSGNKAEMESMQRQFEQGCLSFWASAVFPTSIFNFSPWNLSAKNQNHLGNKVSPIRNCSCWVCLANQQQSSCAAFTQYFLILRKCWQGTPVFRGKHLTFTFLWPIPLSCYSYMSSIASAGHCMVKALFVCMLGSIYNKSGST